MQNSATFPLSESDATPSCDSAVAQSDSLASVSESLDDSAMPRHAHVSIFDKAVRSHPNCALSMRTALQPCCGSQRVVSLSLVSWWLFKASAENNAQRKMLSHREVCVELGKAAELQVCYRRCTAPNLFPALRSMRIMNKKSLQAHASSITHLWPLQQDFHLQSA